MSCWLLSQSLVFLLEFLHNISPAGKNFGIKIRLGRRSLLVGYRRWRLVGLLHVPLFHYCPTDRLPLVRLLYFGLRRFRRLEWIPDGLSRVFVCQYSSSCRDTLTDSDRIVILRLFLRRISFPDVVNDSINPWGWSGLARAGVAAEVDGEFMKLLASEYAVMRKMGPPGVSRMLKVVIVDDDCSCLGLVFSRDLFSDKLE